MGRGKKRKGYGQGGWRKGKKGRGEDGKAAEVPKKKNGGDATDWSEAFSVDNPEFVHYYRDLVKLTPPEEWEELRSTIRQHLPMAFRVNAAHPDAAKVQARLKELVKEAEAGGPITHKGQLVAPGRSLEWYPQGYAWQFGVHREAFKRVPQYQALHKWIVHQTKLGLLSRQEAVSMIPPLLLRPEGHHIVLDMCAAPGSKTAQLIEYVQAKAAAAGGVAMPSGLVLANDVSSARARTLANNVSRLRSPCAVVVHHNAKHFPEALVPSEEVYTSSAALVAGPICGKPKPKPRAGKKQKGGSGKPKPDANPSSAATAAAVPPSTSAGAVASAVAGATGGDGGTTDAGAGSGAGAGAGAGSGSGSAEAEAEAAAMPTEGATRSLPPKKVWRPDRSLPDISVVGRDLTPDELLEGVYDRVLADVPCSGDGTIRKNPDAWLKWKTNNALALHSLQLEIAARGLRLLKVGGVMAYSTCSLNPIENEAVVSSLLRRFEGCVHLLPTAELLPGLKRRTGRFTWPVVDRDMVVHTEPNPKKGMKETMFPPSEDVAMAQNLDRCMRLLPHLQNTGGFFVALIAKTAPLHLRGAQRRAIFRARDGPASRFEKHMDASHRNRSLPNLTPVPAEVQAKVTSVLGLRADFPVDHLCWRGESKKSLWLVSPAVRRCLRLNGNLQVEVAGVKGVMLTKEGFPSIVPDAASVLAPFMRQAPPRLPFDDVVTLLSAKLPAIFSVESLSAEARAAFAAHTCSSFPPLLAVKTDGMDEVQQRAVREVYLPVTERRGGHLSISMRKGDIASVMGAFRMVGLLPPEEQKAATADAAPTPAAATTHGTGADADESKQAPAAPATPAPAAPATPAAVAGVAAAATSGSDAAARDAAPASSSTEAAAAADVTGGDVDVDGDVSMT